MKTNFADMFQNAIETQIPDLLEHIETNYYEQIPQHLKGNFNQLKSEYLDRPNNFVFGTWKSKVKTLIYGFGFEIEYDETNENKKIDQKTPTEKGSRIINAQNYFENIENIQNINFNQNNNDE